MTAVKVMNTPLADRIRPTAIDEVAGQHHLLDEGRVLRKIIETGNIPNLIFYGLVRFQV